MNSRRVSMARVGSVVNPAHVASAEPRTRSQVVADQTTTPSGPVGLDSAAPTATNVLGRQRAAGNRVTGQMLARAASEQPAGPRWPASLATPSTGLEVGSQVTPEDATIQRALAEHRRTSPADADIQRAVGNRAVMRLLARVTEAQQRTRAEQIWVGSGRPALPPGGAEELANRRRARRELTAIETAAAQMHSGDYQAAEKEFYLRRFRGYFAVPIGRDPTTVGQAWDSGALRCLCDFSARLRPLVGNAVQLRILGGYINDGRFGGQPAYAERAEALLRHNAAFPAASALKLAIYPNRFADYLDLLTVVEQLSPAERGDLNGVDPATLLEIATAAADKRTGLRILAASRGTQGQPGLVSEATVARLEPIFRNCPPGEFRGFAAWGLGNKGSAENNMFEHFLKHVMADYEAGETAPPEDETKMWWWGANLTVNLRTLLKTTDQKVLSIIDDDLNGAFGPNWRANAAALTVDYSNAAGLKALTKVSKRIPSLAYRLYLMLGPAYTSYVLHSSRKMREVQVHLSQSDYFVSGMYGHVYIVGRFVDGVAAISSAYWVPDPETKLAAARQNRVWLVEQ